MKIGLSSAKLRQRPGRLGAGIGVFELQKKLAGFYLVAIVDQHAFHRGRCGSMGLKILYWLNFAVGGNGGGNLLAHDFFGPDRSHSTAHLPAGKEQKRNNSSCRNQQQVISFQETVFLFPHHLKRHFSV